MSAEITLTIKGERISLTQSEAMKLYNDLRPLFSVERLPVNIPSTWPVDQYPPPYVPFQTPTTSPPWTITCSAGGEYSFK